MLIFVIPSSYPNPDNPVANSFIKEQVAAIAKKNSDIVVLNVRKQPMSRFFKKVDGKIHFENDGCSDIVSKKQKTFFERFFPSLNQKMFERSMKAVYDAAVKKYGKPDLIYAHFYSASSAAAKIVKKDNIPIVSLEHSGDIMSDSMPCHYRRKLKHAVEKSSKYIATTPALKENIVKHTGTKKELEIIPNIIDDSFTYYPRTNKEKFVFFSVSRFTYDKRLDLLVESFADAFSPEEAVELCIGGGGKEFDAIKRRISELGREKQIILLGMLDRHEVLDHMINCDVFVLPSRHETFGLVWREAMCVGRPVITTNHGGFGGDWSNEYGMMIPIDDKDALSTAMIKIRQEYDSYQNEVISKNNRDMYSSDKISEKLLMIFNEITNHGGNQ